MPAAAALQLRAVASAAPCEHKQMQSREKQHANSGINKHSQRPMLINKKMRLVCKAATHKNSFR